MKVYVLSDLHAEFEPFVPPSLEVDLVVLAGTSTRKREGSSGLTTPSAVMLRMSWGIMSTTRAILTERSTRHARPPLVMCMC